MWYPRRDCLWCSVRGSTQIEEYRNEWENGEGELKQVFVATWLGDGRGRGEAVLGILFFVGILPFERSWSWISMLCYLPFS